MNKRLIAKAQKNKNVKYIFCDYYDTVVHRRVHPLQPFKIWAKLLKEKASLEISINEIYKIRRNAMSLLSSKLGFVESEISYETVIKEVYDRLIDMTAINSKISFNTFLKYSSEADYKSESSVQYLNKKTVATIQFLKNEGYIVYCVSDFYSDEDLLSRLIAYHGINHLYDKVYVSAAQNASKENKGLLFKYILEKENISSTEVLMVGDNPISDVANAKLQGIEAHYLKRFSYKFRQKYQFLILLLREQIVKN